jgi:hypothetical protein
MLFPHEFIHDYALAWGDARWHCLSFTDFANGCTYWLYERVFGF